MAVTNNTSNLRNITAQIQRYVRQIKAEKQFLQPQEHESFSVSYANDLKYNLNFLNGNNKFSIHNFINETPNSTDISVSYAAAAYNHLSNEEDKNKILIDFIHEYNRNFDMKA